MRTRIKWLAFSAFRSFPERTVVSFPEQGLTSIRGFNLDTGGSSGSGKTNVILAINYALGISPLPATNLQSWLTDEPMRVELCLETDDGEVIISRGGKLSLTVNGTVLKGSAALLEEKLRLILGLPSDLLEALTYRQQQTRGYFLSKRNAEKQEFLMQLLGLSKFESAIEKTGATIKSLEPQETLLLGEIQRCEEEVGRRKTMIGDPELIDEVPLQMAANKIKEEIAALETGVLHHKQFLREAEARIQAKTDEISRSYLPTLQGLQTALQIIRVAPVEDPRDLAEEKRVNDLLEQAQGFLKQAIADDEAAKRAEQKRARDLQGQLDQSRRELAAMETLKEKGRALLEEISTLERNICPTCERTWEQAQGRKRSLELELQQTADRLQEMQLEGIPDHIARLEKEIPQAWQHTPHPDIARLQGIVTKLMHESSEIEQHNAYLMQEAELKKKARVSEAEAALKACQAEALEKAQIHRANATEKLLSHKERLEELEGQLRAANARLQGVTNEAYTTSMRNAEARQRAETEIRLLKEAENRLAAARTRAEGVVGQLAAERDFLRLVGREGFLGAIFDEVLWEISDETNRILGGIPNTAHVTVTFKSETTTQKGKINKEIVPVAIIGGHEAPLRAGCSGGMYAAVELAVDLAVAAVVSRRTGAVPSWVILDEAFEGLGPVEKEGCLEILQVYASDKLVLVVDHASEIKGVFQHSIDVEHSGGVSKVCYKASAME